MDLPEATGADTDMALAEDRELWYQKAKSFLRGEQQKSDGAEKRRPRYRLKVVYVSLAGEVGGLVVCSPEALG